MNDRIRQKLKTLTTRPGVYVMKDASGQIIYIGKAKNLKNRVSQYFHSSQKPSKVQAMVDKIDDFEYFIATSELDALALESNLIHKHQPFYNILLKDGKAFPYIRIDMKEDFPRPEIVRRVKKNDGAKYFGPYIAGIDPRAILKTISTAFKVRTCNKKIDGTAKRECLNFSLGLCLAPCTGRVSKEEYRKEIDKVVQFLSGNDEEIEETLQQRMQIASDMQNFERAIELREALKMVQKLKERVVANLPKNVDKDVFAYKTDGLSGVVTVMVVRGGKILGVMNFVQSDAELSENDTLFNFMVEYYRNCLVPHEIITSCHVDEELLRAVLGKKVQITSNPRGVNATLLAMAKENAEEHLCKHLEREKLMFNQTQGAMMQLQEALSLKSLPRRIECYDISHISGTNKVASMVVFENGEASKKDYRKFKITTPGNNDFESLKEALRRRLKRLLEKNGESFCEKPDLLVIDGGKGQLSSCVEILNEFDLDGKIEIIALAKRLEEVFVVGQSEPVRLKYGSASLRLLQRVRDEAHRFAITFHRSLREKNQTHTELEDIRGLGKVKIDALLAAFGTTDAIKAATVEELLCVKGISPALANEIFEHFRATKKGFEEKADEARLRSFNE